MTTLTIGKPGMTACASVDVFRDGSIADVCTKIEDEKTAGLLDEAEAIYCGDIMVTAYGNPIYCEEYNGDTNTTR